MKKKDVENWIVENSSVLAAGFIFLLYIVICLLSMIYDYLVGENTFLFIAIVLLIAMILAGYIYKKMQ